VAQVSDSAGKAKGLVLSSFSHGSCFEHPVAGIGAGVLLAFAVIGVSWARCTRRSVPGPLSRSRSFSRSRSRALSFTEAASDDDGGCDAGGLDMEAQPLRPGATLHDFALLGGLPEYGLEEYGAGAGSSMAASSLPNLLACQHATCPHGGVGGTCGKPGCMGVVSVQRMVVQTPPAIFLSA
jgi:hypothetical protein